MTLLAGRSRSDPLGTQTYPAVFISNMMVARSGILLAMAWLRSFGFVLEQPQSSMISEHPALRFFASAAKRLPCLNWQHVRTNLGAFGGPRPKAIQLWSNRKWAHKLKRNLKGLSFDSGEAAGIVQDLGGGKVAGGKNLKATQEYTPEFGDAVFDAWNEHEPEESMSAKDADSEYLEADGGVKEDEVDPQWSLAQVDKALELYRGQERV